MIISLLFEKFNQYYQNLPGTMTIVLFFHPMPYLMSGLYRFRELLSYKQECFGFLLKKVDRWFPSSKTCSVCGNIQDMPLCERVDHCQNCGQVMDRDLNASINLESWTNNADGLSVNPERSRRVEACGQEGVVSLG